MARFLGGLAAIAIIAAASWYAGGSQLYAVLTGR
jgi:hypothetical protein